MSFSSYEMGRELGIESPSPAMPSGHARWLKPIPLISPKSVKSGMSPMSRDVLDASPADGGLDSVHGCPPRAPSRAAAQANIASVSAQSSTRDEMNEVAYISSPAMSSGILAWARALVWWPAQCRLHQTSGMRRTGASGGRTGACGGGTRHRRLQVAAEFAVPEESRPSFHCPHWRGLTWEPSSS